MGIAEEVPEISHQLDELSSTLDANDGWFVREVHPGPFHRWVCYEGLALERPHPEKDYHWSDDAGRIRDLTFRSLLILRLAGRLA